MTARVDDIWDALTEHFGPVRTQVERKRRNAAVKQLREAEATPDEIRIASEFCQRNFTSYTEMAVCSWLSRSLLEHSAKMETRQIFLRALQGGRGD